MVATALADSRLIFLAVSVSSILCPNIWPNWFRGLADTGERSSDDYSDEFGISLIGGGHRRTFMDIAAEAIGTCRLSYGIRTAPSLTLA
jgi:hypothetical protein